MYKNSFTHYLTKFLVDAMFLGGLICCIAVPFVMPWLAERFGYRPQSVLPFTAILLAAGLCSEYILWQLRAMFKTLLGGNPFVGANVTCLRRCAVASLAIALIFVAKSIFWFTLATAIIVIMFTMLGLFCLTLKDLFKQAVAYKEEHDWTV